jgi:hypothetical protein
MKEKKFAQYVTNEKDMFRKLPRANRGNIELYIRDFTSKEVAMVTDNEWNVMSPEDAMVMALVNIIDAKKEQPTKRQKNNPTEELSSEEKQKRYEDRLPAWKKVEPKDGESMSMTKDSKEYFWCKKCRNGKGMWALHKTEQHTSGYKPKPKKVSFQADAKSEDTPDTTSGDNKDNKPKTGPSQPSISVKKELLTNAKAYLAQFSDFQQGGTQG